VDVEGLGSLVTDPVAAGTATPDGTVADAAVAPAPARVSGRRTAGR
jgi:hypothetical protein